MRRIITIASVAATVAICLACRGSSVEEPSPIPVRVSAVRSACVFDDTEQGGGFVSGDRLGLYMVNHPDSLAASGNHADNVPLAFSDSLCSSSVALWWPDDAMLVDFYCYYPYNEDIDDVRSWGVSVAGDQSGDAGFYGSDILCGSLLGVAPTADTVHIDMNHLCACLQIMLKSGVGLTDADILGAEVIFSGVRTAGRLNLADGSMIVAGEPVSVTPYCKDTGIYMAFLPPQALGEDFFVEIYIDNIPYKLPVAADLVSGNSSRCSLTVSRTGEGIDVIVGDWETDDTDYGGVVE